MVLQAGKYRDDLELDIITDINSKFIGVFERILDRFEGRFSTMSFIKKIFINLIIKDYSICEILEGFLKIKFGLNCEFFWEFVSSSIIYKTRDI